VIQGQADADVDGRLTKDVVSQTIEFCMKAAKMKAGIQTQDLEKLSEEEINTLGFRGDLVKMDGFESKSIGGMLPNLEVGHLGLTHEMSAKGNLTLL